MTLLPKVKLKALVNFPATVLDGVGVDVVKQNGNYQFNLDFGDFSPPVAFVPDPPHQNALLWNNVTGQYSLVPISVIATGGAVPEAPTDGTVYGRKNATWVDAWASPIFSGNPTAPTPTAGDNDTSVATTAFVTAAVAAVAPSNANPAMDGIAAPGIAVTYARGDHVHPTDTTRAPLASPVFTGDPRAPTAAPGDNDTSIATTAFVVAAVAAGGGGSGGIPEAPTDGVQYGRQSISWTPIAAPVPPATVVPLIESGAGAVGVATKYAREDHVHPAGVTSVGGQVGAVYLPQSSGLLSKSGANIILLPFYGNILTINGVNAVIPDVGVTLAPTGLTVGTLYYIYATQSGGTINALEASTTAYAISTTAGSQGLMVKTGDVTRRLVGSVRPIAGPAFSDLPAQRFVRSWLNRKQIHVRGAAFNGSTTAVGAGSAVEISATARVEFLIFADEAVDLGHVGTVYNSSAGQSTYSGISIDGAVAGIGFAGGVSTASNGDNSATPRVTSGGLADGYHYATVVGWVSGGTGTWYASGVPQIYGTISG